MIIAIRDTDHVGELRLQVPWVSVFGICGVVLECWARRSGTVHIRKGAGDRGSGGFFIKAPGWFNNGPFYVKPCFQLSVSSQETSDDELRFPRNGGELSK